MYISTIFKKLGGKYSEERCPSDMKWLREKLSADGLKAYNPKISTSDPKNRKTSNEIKDWCVGDDIKFWCTKTNRFVKSIEFKDGKRLKSVPTNNSNNSPE
tara:strand:- start:1801 stop:2103 length:303 start_codon:yes stop_codon:yes gene_type:complete